MYEPKMKETGNSVIIGSFGNLKNNKIKSHTSKENTFFPKTKSILT